MTGAAATPPMTSGLRRGARPLVAAVLLAGAGSALAAPGDVLWRDEFDAGSAPDGNAWSYDLGASGWGNAELQEYTAAPANVRIEGGHLVITARDAPTGGGQRSFTSARIKTENKLTFKYATIEARIMVPSLANGLWPAFWTLGNNFASVGWPSCGELDVMEMGSQAAIQGGLVNRRVSSTAHWEHNGSRASYGLSLDSAAPLDGTFRNFRMEWTPSLVSTYLDGQRIWSMDITPASCTDCTEFHEPHFMLLNLAVGGNFTGLLRAGDITAPFPAEMRVDWVRVIDNGHTVVGGTAIGGGGTRARVASITPAVAGSGPKKRAGAAIAVIDQAGVAVAGARVTATFTGSHNETVAALTDAAGIAQLVTAGASGATAFTVCTGSVSGPGLTYDATASAEACDALSAPRLRRLVAFPKRY